MDAYEHQIEELMASATKKIQESSMGSGQDLMQFINEGQLKGLVAVSLAMATMVHTLIALHLELNAAIYLTAEYMKTLALQASRTGDSTEKS